MWRNIRINMARTESNFLELGAKAFDFSLLNPIDKKTYNLEDFPIDDTNGLAIMFICNHCPFVVHIAEGISAYAKDYSAKGIKVVAINSNDVANYPADSPEKMIEFAAKYGFNFPYLFDETQSVAKEYKAACTPDLYLFDSKLKLVYHGQFDGARPGNDIEVTGKDFRAATDALLSGKIQENQLPSVGCNIKWKN